MRPYTISSVTTAQKFRPNFVGVTPQNVTASCNASTGVVTVTYNLPSPHSASAGFSSNTTWSDFRTHRVEAAIIGGCDYAIGIYSWSETSGDLYSSPDSFSSGSKPIKTLYNYNPSTVDYSFSPTSVSFETGISTKMPIAPNGLGNSVSYRRQVPTFNGSTFQVSFTINNSWTSIPEIVPSGKVTSGQTYVYLRIVQDIAKNYTNLADANNKGTTYYYSNYAKSNLFTLSGPLIPTGQYVNSDPTGFSISGRTFSWTATHTPHYPYIFVSKWNGSSWDILRQGYSLGDYYTGAGSSNHTSYTVPVSDGSGYFYIAVANYSNVKLSFSNTISSNSYLL